jgi:hypothetical protein
MARFEVRIPAVEGPTADVVARDVPSGGRQSRGVNVLDLILVPRYREAVTYGIARARTSAGCYL